MDKAVKRVPGGRAGSTYYMCEDFPGFYYKLKSKRNDVKYLVCIEKNCGARASCDENTFLTLKTDGHSHLPTNEAQEKAWAVKKEIVDAAVSTSEEAKSIYLKHTTRVAAEVGGKLAFTALAQSMRRQRRKVQPTTPTTLHELGEVCATNIRYGYVDGKQFCRGAVGQEGSKSVLFLAEGIEAILSNATELHIDGTFKTRPRHPDSAQLLTVMAVQYGIAFPCCFALMENRKTETYNALFCKIKNLIPSLAPTLLMSDYELPLVKSLRENFPTASINGCFFHYCQAILRQARIIGMIQFLTECSNAQKALKMIMCLALLPAEDIPTGRARIEGFLEETRISAEFSTLLRYHKKQWMERVGPASFSVYGRTRRTNNDCESFHATLERTLRIRSPNIWEFLDTLGQLAANVGREIHAFIEEGLEIRSHQKRKYILNNIRIRNATSVYTRDSDALSFLNSVASSVNGLLNVALAENPATDDREEPLLARLAAGPADGNENERHTEQNDDMQQQHQPTQVNPTCVICKDSPPTTVIIPCGHFGLCNGCKEEVQRLQNTPQRPDEEEGYVVNYHICPLDRRPIENLILVIHT